MSIQQLCLIIVLAPLFGSIVAGFFRNQIGRVGAHSVTIAGVALSFLLSLYVAGVILSGTHESVNVNLYTWASGGLFFPMSFILAF